ncbi:TPA: EpsG family protein [Photobacterium damselae]
MSLYYLLILYIPLILLAVSKQYISIIKFIFLVLFFIFVYLHIDSGPDHIVYKWTYNQPLFSVSFEPLYLLCVSLGKLLNLDYINFLYLFRFISLSVFSYAVYLLDKKRFVLLMGLYIPIMMITFELNLLRQGLSFHFEIIAICFYIKGKNKLSFLFLFFAILSHISAVLMIFLYIKKLTKFNLFLIVLIIAILFYNINYIMFKLDAYSDNNSFLIRINSSNLQVVLLIILPFLFFKFNGDIRYKIYYILLTMMTVVSIFVRLYPMAILMLLPMTLSSRMKPKWASLFLFLLISLIIAVGKTYLLIDADQKAIYDGVYSSGYIK